MRNVDLWLLCAPTLAAGLYACSSAQFSGESRQVQATRKPTPAIATTKSLSLSCTDGAKPDFVINVDAHNGDQATLSGQLCPVASAKATVLFVVDFSGSMKENDPTVTAAGHGSCGRLQAAQAVIKAAQAAGGDISVGLIPFAGDVLADRIIAPEPLATFASLIDAAHFCSFVGFEPGSIDGGSVDASTNYAAAFASAGTALSGADGQKTVYFISDGEPTSGGSDPVQAGIDAGKSLRQAQSDAVLDGLLLGKDGAQAKDTLTAVVGSQDRVRLAASASDLAQEIVKFPSLDLALGSAAATLQVDGGALQTLSLGSFAAWNFVTAVFALHSDPSRFIDHKVTVSAQTQAGQAFSSQATIRVRRL